MDIGSETGSAEAGRKPPHSSLQSCRRALDSLHARALRTIEEGTTDLPLEGIARMHGLSDFEKMVLLATLGPDLDVTFERALDDMLGGRRSREVGTILTLLCDSLQDKIRARRHFIHDAPLLRSGLLGMSFSRDLHSETEFMTMELELPRRVASMILGEYDVEDQILSFSKVIEPQVRLDQVVLPDGQVEELLSLVRDRDSYLIQRREWGFDKILPYGKGTVILFSGPPGTGKTMLAHALARESGCRLMLVDLRQVVEHSPRHSFDENLQRVFHEARLQNAILFFDEADELFSDRCVNGLMPTLLREFERMDSVCILATNRGQVLDEALDRRILHKLEFEIPVAEQRAEIWRRHLPPEAPLAGDIDCCSLADEFEFSGGYIKNAVLAAAAKAMRRADDIPFLTQADLRGAALAQRRNRLSGCADKIVPTVCLRDVILDASTRNAVDEFLCAARNGSTVMSTWGFGRKLSRGKGVVALFSGPSGVGKTMTAEAVAGEMGRALQIVRLDAVVSKYVGDTAKNISALFRGARESDAVLFIDEADALLGSRLPGGDHHARHVNQEVNVLLSEMEMFTGALVLATNRTGDMDPAFERRIQFHVRFTEPDCRARAAIWRALIPPEAPIADDIDFDDLARRYSLTGGVIRNILLRAAYRAAGNGGVITSGALMEAAEMQSPLKDELEIGFRVGG